jgi:hypothetical protein
MCHAPEVLLLLYLIGRSRRSLAAPLLAALIHRPPSGDVHWLLVFSPALSLTCARNPDSV